MGCTVLFLADAQAHRSPSASAARTGALNARMPPVSAEGGRAAARQPFVADCTPLHTCFQIQAKVESKCVCYGTGWWP